jgi:2-iminoacetate synthase
MSFTDVYNQYSFDDIARELGGEESFRYAMRGRPSEAAGSASAFSGEDVRRAIGAPAGHVDVQGFKALLSPAAVPFQAEIEAKAESLTRSVFGTSIDILAPLYMSNTCKTVCTYCGFSYKNDIKRTTLSPDEIEREAHIIRGEGIHKIIALTGEDYVATPVTYLTEAMERISKLFTSLRLEVYPLEEEDYAKVHKAGATGIVVYQETYDQVRYKEVHLRGMKKKFFYRLECLDRAARAGVKELSPGGLLGLSDPATDTFFVGLHARYLLDTYQDLRLTISLPRLRPAAGFENVPSLPDDLYIRMFCAIRLFLPEVNLILSTREPPEFRRHLAPLCITGMGASANLAPGGYSGRDTTAQFALGDSSSVIQVSQMLSRVGLKARYGDKPADVKA